MVDVAFMCGSVRIHTKTCHTFGMPPTSQASVYTYQILGRDCKYGGEQEYWVEVRETGEKGQELEHKKARKEITEEIGSHQSNHFLFVVHHNYLDVVTC